RPAPAAPHTPSLHAALPTWIDAVSHPANPIVTADELDRNPGTLDNIRLLDPGPLNATLNELQALRPLYRFSDIDISRYPLGAERSEEHTSELQSRENIVCRL